MTRSDLGAAVVLLGSLFTLLAAIGVNRFNDVFIRMHALSKASTLGVLLAIGGATIAAATINDVSSAALAALLHLGTSPIGNNIIARATYWAEGIPHGIDTYDELAETYGGEDARRD